MDREKLEKFFLKTGTSHKYIITEGMKMKRIIKKAINIQGHWLKARLVRTGGAYAVEVCIDLDGVPEKWGPILDSEHLTTREGASALFSLLENMPKIMGALGIPKKGNVQSLVTQRGLHNSNSTLAEVRVWNMGTNRSAHAYIDTNEGFCIDL
jgi:hypothetical protein